MKFFLKCIKLNTSILTPNNTHRTSVCLFLLMNYNMRLISLQISTNLCTNLAQPGCFFLLPLMFLNMLQKIQMRLKFISTMCTSINAIPFHNPMMYWLHMRFQIKLVIVFLGTDITHVFFFGFVGSHVIWERLFVKECFAAYFTVTFLVVTNARLHMVGESFKIGKFFTAFCTRKGYWSIDDDFFGFNSCLK